MYIYLDESYNLQKKFGKMFISINGFGVVDEKALMKRWRKIRKPYALLDRRIHAKDSTFDLLRKKSIQLLISQDAHILSIFQLVQELPHRYFGKREIEFDLLYIELLKILFRKLPLNTYKKVYIIVDSRKTKGNKLDRKQIRNDMQQFLTYVFPETQFYFKTLSSHMDILLELADFVSNTFYKEYQSDSRHVFRQAKCRVIQIKNPL